MPNDKDLPLRDDIRLLGRILGDTIREQSDARRSGTDRSTANHPGIQLLLASRQHR